MIQAPNKPAPPTDDRRWKVVDATMRRLSYTPAALIETLHTTQETFGYIDDVALGYVSACLNVPPSQAYGIATFYNLFKMKPSGRHTMALCMGTACYVKGSGEILKYMKEEFGLEPGETTPDGELSLVAARCVGACGLAPVMVLDGEVVGKLGIGEMKLRIKDWISHDNE